MIAATPTRFDSEALFEYANGERIDLPPSSVLAIRVASKLLAKLGQFVEGKLLSEPVGYMLFNLAAPSTRVRRVDVAFVSAKTIAQAPLQLASDDAWELVPELMVEVVNPTDLAYEIIERIDEYFRAGTKLMWVIFPEHRLIHVYFDQFQVRLLTAADDLDGGSVLPGFRIPVASLFPTK